MSSKVDYSSKSLSGLSSEKLVDSLKTLKKELFNLRFQQTSGELSNTNRFSVVKKNVARVKTELTKRKKSGE